MLVNEAMQDNTQIFIKFISRKPEPVIGSNMVSVLMGDIQGTYRKWI